MEAFDSDRLVFFSRALDFREHLKIECRTRSKTKFMFDESSSGCRLWADRAQRESSERKFISCQPDGNGKAIPTAEALPIQVKVVPKRGIHVGFSVFVFIRITITSTEILEILFRRTSFLIRHYMFDLWERSLHFNTRRKPSVIWVCVRIKSGKDSFIGRIFCEAPV